jgi:hypothetical protein
MVDWFVILTPLFALPIIALFVFVGCVLDRSGIVATQVGLPLAMFYPDGLKTSVAQIAVWFEVVVPPQVPSGAEIGNLKKSFSTSPTTIHNASIAEIGGTISQWVDNLNLHEYALITCHCVVITSSTPADESVPGTVHTLQVGPRYKEEDDTTEFVLQHENGQFQLV